jgi:hypothetical protein
MEGELAAGSSYQTGRPHYPAGAGPFRRLDGAGRVVVALLVANVVLDLVAVVTDIQMMGLVDRAKGGRFVSVEEADSLDLRMARIGLLQLVSVLMTAIAFAFWIRRAYRNLGALGVRWLRFKLGWAVAGCFVPFINLARPKSIANDIWRATDPALPREIDEPPAGGRVAPLLNWWWAAWIVSGFLDGSGDGLDARASLDEILSQAQRYAAGDTVSVISGILAILVVRAITDRMHRRHEMLASGAAGLVP